MIFNESRGLHGLINYNILDSNLHMDKLFIKYEFWPNLLNELKRVEVPTILVSGILREKQLFFNGMVVL